MVEENRVQMDRIRATDWLLVRRTWDVLLPVVGHLPIPDPSQSQQDKTAPRRPAQTVGSAPSAHMSSASMTYMH